MAQLRRREGGGGDLAAEIALAPTTVLALLGEEEGACPA